MTARDPLDHYDVAEDDPCTCRYCLEWRRRRDVVDRYRMLFNFRRCKCVKCKDKPRNPIWECMGYQENHYAFVAAAVRRDLWIEMSYHAKFGTEQDGRELMAWLDAKIRSMEKHKNGKPRDGWWSTHAERYPLDHWFCAFDNFVRAKEIAKSAVEDYC